MQIAGFEDLVQAAASQPRPQRMLFVFMKTVVQKDYTPEQRAAVEADEGGALMPQFCVDKTPHEVTNLSALVREADQQSPDWDKVLVACMDDDAAATSGGERATEALKTMIARVQSGGDLSAYLCFTRSGEPVRFG